MTSRTYVGTKAFAIKGTLLDPSTVTKLAEAASLDELVNRLRATPYSTALSGLSPPYSARKIELALRGRLATVHHTIMQGAGKYRIIELYYLRNIAWDLKLALKAKALNRTYEETVEYLDMTAEQLVGRRDLLAKVLTAKDVNEAVSMLSGTEFSVDAEKALAAYSTKGEVRFFDIYIEHAVLSAISREYSQNSKLYAYRTDANGVKDIVAVDVDAYNVASVLRAKLWGLRDTEIQELIITPVGRVNTYTLKAMTAAESVTEGVKLLESSYRFTMQGAPNDEALIDTLEEAFAKELRQTASLAFVWQGLSPGTILAVIRLMDVEVGNLAAIAIGVEAGMDPKQILAKLRT
jgi:V/A-type H+-transporting ATPase subunit C